MNPELPQSNRQGAGASVIVWWIIWGAILIGLTMIYVFVGQRPRAQPAAAASVIEYVAVGPLVLSSVIRWLWFPRIERREQAFVIFIVGIALAEGTGILGMFLTQQGLTFTALGALGIVQWMPLFVGKYGSSGPSLS